MSKIKIYAISGDGNGAGKSTLAQRLVGKDNVISLAALMREELKASYPQYDWFNKDQGYKENTKVVELENKSVRQVLIEYGQSKCEKDPWYWVRALVLNMQNRVGVFALDDLRKVVEIDMLRGFFGPSSVVHFHVAFDGAKKELIYDNDKLRARADFVIKRDHKEPVLAPLTVWGVFCKSHVKRSHEFDFVSGPYVSRDVAQAALTARADNMGLAESSYYLDTYQISEDGLTGKPK